MPSGTPNRLSPRHISEMPDPSQVNTGSHRATGIESCEPHALCECPVHEPASALGECPTCHHLRPAFVSPLCVDYWADVERLRSSTDRTWLSTP